MPNEKFGSYMSILRELVCSVRRHVMLLNSKRYLVVCVRGCRSLGSCVFKRQCKSIFKKGKMDLVYGNFIRNICKKALRFWGVSLYRYNSLIMLKTLF